MTGIEHFQCIKKFLLVPGFIPVTSEVQSMTVSMNIQHGCISGPGKIAPLIFSLFTDAVCDICGISLLSKVSLSSNPRDHVKLNFS